MSQEELLKNVKEKQIQKVRQDLLLRNKFPALTSIRLKVFSNKTLKMQIAIPRRILEEAVSQASEHLQRELSRAVMLFLGLRGTENAACLQRALSLGRVFAVATARIPGLSGSGSWCQAGGGGLRGKQPRPAVFLRTPSRMHTCDREQACHACFGPGSSQALASR